MISIEQLSVQLSGHSVLKGISCELAGGTISGIIGPNGCGKTTLLRALAGDVQFSGVVHLPVSANAARCMAFLPQQSSLHFAFTVAEVVAMGRMPHETGIVIDERIAEEVMRALDITALKYRLYPELSGGEKQRVQLARVCAQIWRVEDSQYRLLLLDEPMASLDWGHKQQLVRLLKRLSAGGVTVIVVEHDMQLLANFADELLAVQQGRLVAKGRPSAVLSSELLLQLFDADVKVMIHDEQVQLIHRAGALL